MSYPSINRHLELMGTTVESANDDQMQAAFVAAFKEDLPLGWAKVTELVTRLKDTMNAGGERVMLSLAPNSDEGKQYARLLGPDIPRQVLERHFGVSFGFYNCCRGVAAEEKGKLKLSMREQIQAQHPNFVNC